MIRLQGPLIAVAAILTLYATASFMTGFNADFEVSAGLAALCVVAAIAIEHVDHGRRRRMQEGRDAVWQRRIKEMKR